MKDYNKILDFFYDNDDIVCVVTVPEFMGRKQRFCKVADLRQEKWIRFLRSANANNSNIYLSVYTFLQPQRTENSVVSEVDRIFLDFDVPGAYENFRKDFEPTIVISTSSGKYQAFLKISEPASKEEAKIISRTIARLYNADHAFDLARIFRLPDFRNVKYSTRPLVTIHEYNPNTTYQSYNLPCVSQPREELTKVPAAQEERKDDTNIVSTPKSPTSSLSVSPRQHDYQHFLNSVPMKHNGDPDFSRADLKYAIYLLSHVHDDAEIVKDMLQKSRENISDLEQKKGAGIDNYLNKTIDKAKEYIANNYKPYSPRR